MAIDGITDVCTQGVEVVTFRKDRLTQSPRRITALDSVLNKKNDLVHVPNSVQIILRHKGASGKEVREATA